MSALKKVKLPDFGGRKDALPVISVEEYRRRIEAAVERMASAGLDFLAVYGDREHFANLAHLSGFDPRFEEALLLLNRSGDRLLIVGNECMGYLPDPAIGCRVELFQDFSLMGQPRGSSKPLRTILSGFGIGRGAKLGCAGWKYYDAGLIDGGEGVMDAPAYLVDLLRELAGDRQAVRNATDIFINPRDGLRTVNSADGIALMAFAAIHTSQAVKASLEGIRPGVRECDLPMHATAAGLPYSCHTMVIFGDLVRRGLSSPTQRKARRGDSYVLALGIWGSLSCRAGMVAARPKDLAGELKDFYPRFAANYFDVAVAWYEKVKVGALSGEIYAAAHATRDAKLMDFAVNPGHLIGMDEWLHSPFQAGSTVPLRSGMAIQMDIIPVSKGSPCYSNVEDGIALADQTLRAELAKRHPACWKRIAARRKFMAGKLGIELDPSVLPLSNTPAWLPPYTMDTETIFVKE
jgi:Xaa-Pro aminopeptidase